VPTEGGETVTTTRRRRRPAVNRDDLEAAAVAAAAAAGLRLAGPALTATLVTRCSPKDREAIAELAAARGMSVAEHVRSRALAPLTREEIEAARVAADARRAAS